MHVVDKNKCIEVRWVKFPQTGILHCSCGRWQAFKFNLIFPPGFMPRVKCNPAEGGCGKEWAVDLRIYRGIMK
jgi:hypothetical protein